MGTAVLQVLLLLGHAHVCGCVDDVKLNVLSINVSVLLLIAFI